MKKYYQRNKDARKALLSFFRLRIIEKVDYNVFDSTPTSFIITAGLEDHEYSQFIARFKDFEKQDFSKESIPRKHCEENFWLVKPANENQGTYITANES